MKSVAFHNLGCKTNSYELDAMQQIIQKAGYEIVQFEQKADVYIVNTCTVTNIADRKSRQMLHRAKQQNPDAVVVAVGCYAQVGRQQLLDDASVDLIIGNNHKSEIVSIIEAYIEEKKKGAPEEDTIAHVSDISGNCDYEDMQIDKTSEHTRAYVKIQDGCNQFCSYCAIPLARGRVRSRMPQDIIEEINALSAAGYREVVLTGIHISSYGIDFSDEEWKNGRAIKAIKTGKENQQIQDYGGDSKLIDLIEMIDKNCVNENLHRIRLGSFEPRIINDEASMRLARISRVCPHFHLSLQSGCDKTLKAMNRRYTADEYLESLTALRNAYGDRNVAITTDVIVGFPGETQEDFEISKEFLKEADFFEMHIFKYSKRSGTRAAAMKEQVPDADKTVRSDELLELEKEMSLAYRQKHIGTTVKVLWEEIKKINGEEYTIGHTEDYVVVAIKSERPCHEIETVNCESMLTEDIVLASM